MENVNLIKIGSDSINEKNLIKIVSDAKDHEKMTGEKFIFLLSGAVKMGKQAIEKAGKDIAAFSKASQASIGQAYLMRMMNEISGEEQLCSQILLDDYSNAEYISEIGISSSKIGQFLGRYYRPSCRYT